MSTNSILNDVKWHLVTKSTRKHWPIVPPEGLYCFSVVDTASISPFMFFLSPCFILLLRLLFLCISNILQINKRKKKRSLRTETNLFFAVVLLTATTLHIEIEHCQKKSVSKPVYKTLHMNVFVLEGTRDFKNLSACRVAQNVQDFVSQ